MKIYIKDVYKKIVEQSKKKFFYDVFFVPNKTDSLIEVFQLNLIVVLWYMKKKEFDQKDITLLISIFLKDLESLCFEIGEAESRIPRKMRKLMVFLQHCNIIKNMMQIIWMKKSRRFWLKLVMRDLVHY